MAIVGATETQVLDLNVDGAAVYFLTRGVVAFTAQGELVSGTWATAVVTLERSNDKRNWYGLESAVSWTGEDMTDQTDACFEWFRARVSTVEGGAGVIEVTVHLLRDA